MAAMLAHGRPDGHPSLPATDCRPRLIWTLPERIGAAVSAGFALLLLALGLRGRRKSLAA